MSYVPTNLSNNVKLRHFNQINIAFFYPFLKHLNTKPTVHICKTEFSCAT